MSDPISAVAASAAQPDINAAASAAQSGSFGSSLSFGDLAGAPSPVESKMTADFQKIVKDFQSRVSNYDSAKNDPATTVASSDTITMHKMDFFPQGAHPGRASDTAITGTTSTPTTKTATATDALNASFDHALFVTLVSQVVSGVGQTVSTLIKQQ